MKLLRSHLAFLMAAATLGTAPVLPAAEITPFVHETEKEFIANGDFDGDGRMDLVIVDRLSGKFRLGYQTAEGTFNWVEWRPSGMKDVAGVAIGKLFNQKQDALAFVSADDNKVSLCDVSSPTAPVPPVVVPPPALGPNSVVAIDLGGAQNTPLLDLYMGSMYNSPEPNKLTLLRNDAGKVSKLSDAQIPGTLSHGNRLALKTGAPELVCVIMSGEKGDTFKAEDVSSGKPATVASVADLPSGSDYFVGHFRGAPLADFVFYKPGGNTLLVRPVEEATPGALKFGAGSSITTEQPVRHIFPVRDSGKEKLLVLWDKGEAAAVFNFDGAKLSPLQTITAPTGDVITAAAPIDNGFIMMSVLAAGKSRSSVRYQTYALNGAEATPGTHGSLASLADTDISTVPDIQKLIAAKTKETKQEDMKAYTNTIPGTDVKYSMVAIPGGEFLMGSPADEPNRQADEGPQHKVKISPFWMGQFEITWNEYELFMFPDDEKKMRENFPTDPEVDKLSDAVTRPSKPYVEMSFGMGKDGYPAISMTQHAANKYCHWLSAKTGHFYRLPTEAEWEYACRAGTTTTYYFGNDVALLPQYAWFEKNSDFKYQKVGKKKPNQWGLYDMYGNVVEWVLDQYDAESYSKAGSVVVEDPWNKATKPYPHAVKGGSWDDPAAKLRSAARRGSDRAWKMQDPQLPKSIWYHSDAQFVGFRLVRPLKVPTAEELNKYWNSGVEKD